MVKRTINCTGTSAWSHGASVTFVIRIYRAVANVTMHILVPGPGGKIGWGIAQYISYLKQKKEYIYLTLKQESSIYKIANLKLMLRARSGPAMIS